MSEEKKEQQPNPIDKDKVTENPGTLPYAHTVGGAVVKPEDKGKMKGRSVSAMHQQAQSQMDQLREQMETLAKQAKEIESRVKISEYIYTADINFEPLIGHTYHLYRKKDGRYQMSMVAPTEWGRSLPYEAFVATVTMLADHTWQVVQKGEEDFFQQAEIVED